MKAARIVVTTAAIVLTLRRYLRRKPHAAKGASEVRYHVPIGQDPAAVLGAVRVEGLAARPEVVAGEPVVVISLDMPGDRDRVREIVRRAPENMEGDPRITESVAFSDEV